MHAEYQSILREAFGRWWVEPGDKGWDLTLDEIWQQDGLPSQEGRIIHVYEVRVTVLCTTHHVLTIFMAPNTLYSWTPSCSMLSVKNFCDETNFTLSFRGVKCLPNSKYYASHHRIFNLMYAALSQCRLEINKCNNYI